MSDETVIYPEIEVRLFTGEDVMTAENAMEYLSWTVPEEEGNSFDPENTHFRDVAGNTVYCHTTTKFQRRWIKKNYTKIKADILKGQFHFNGENIIIGKTGYVLDGKHRLAALVLAAQEYNRNPDRYPALSGPPTIEVSVITGVEEDQAVANTIGTGLTRTISDSLFASGFFDDQPRKDAVRMTRMLENSVRLLWARTGAEHDAFSPIISHADALDFIDNHPGIIDSVKTVYTENKSNEGSLQSFIPLGYLAAGMYLMSTSYSSQEQLTKYSSSVFPNENQLTVDPDKPDSFIALLAAKSESVEPILACIGELISEGFTNPMESLGVIAKGWNLFKEDTPITKKLVRLKTKTIDGIRRVEEDPTFGGIDLGIHVSE